jgi:tRNA-2-methylthio-N6-dimethylallyladenosine synthase
MFKEVSSDGKIIDENRQGEVFFQDVEPISESTKKVYIESYGCQMNFNDSEIVAAIMRKDGYSTTRNIDDADLIFVNGG